uniref:Uncharacterized protein n=1 Tax=Setaria italica TaxID=4555 RepID=K3ZG88_SETIT
MHEFLSEVSTLFFLPPVTHPNRCELFVLLAISHLIWIKESSQLLNM